MDFHSLSAASAHPIENVSADFVLEGLLRARQKSWHAARTLRAKLKAGMTEPEAHVLALSHLESLGSEKNWHRPYVRFGPGTALTFNHSLQKDYKLQEGDPIYLDLGPVWKEETGLEYEGDVGETYVFGKNPEAQEAADLALALFEKAQAEWKSKKLSGEELYAFLRHETENAGYLPGEKVEGHRLSDYPHHKYSKEHLARTTFHPARALWVLEVHLVHPSKKFGAFYEDILL